MRLIIDGDACPVKDIVQRAAMRLDIPLLLISNSRMGFGKAPGVTPIIVEGGPDKADQWIVENYQTGDLVITADIPLAAQIVTKGGLALGHRGEIFDASTVGERMSLLAFHRSLRDEGMNIGGPKPFGVKDRTQFANGLERLIRLIQKQTKASES